MWMGYMGLIIFDFFNILISWFVDLLLKSIYLGEIYNFFCM